MQRRVKSWKVKTIWFNFFFQIFFETDGVISLRNFLKEGEMMELKFYLPDLMQFQFIPQKDWFQHSNAFSVWVSIQIKSSTNGITSVAPDGVNYVLLAHSHPELLFDFFLKSCLLDNYTSSLIKRPAVKPIVSERKWFQKNLFWSKTKVHIPLCTLFKKSVASSAFK